MFDVTLDRASAIDFGSHTHACLYADSIHLPHTFSVTFIGVSFYLQRGNVFVAKGSN